MQFLQQVVCLSRPFSVTLLSCSFIALPSLGPWYVSQLSEGVTVNQLWSRNLGSRKHVIPTTSPTRCCFPDTPNDLGTDKCSASFPVTLLLSSFDVWGGLDHPSICTRGTKSPQTKRKESKIILYVNVYIYNIYRARAPVSSKKYSERTWSRGGYTVLVTFDGCLVTCWWRPGVTLLWRNSYTFQKLRTGVY